MYISTEKITGRVRNRPIKDHSGTRFGRLVAIRLVERAARGDNHRWLFTCDCGEEKISGIKNVRGGRTQSCGCLQTERRPFNNRTHGLSASNHAEYRIWLGMRARCENPKTAGYQRYGGRGIKVCDRWKSFPDFLNDMGARPSPEHSIERIDVNGNYEPFNCKWATRAEQGTNKTNNFRIEFNGITQTLSEWASASGVERRLLAWRIRQGWTLEQALTPQDFRIKA